MSRQECGLGEMDRSIARTAAVSSRDEHEIAGFSAQADAWWDPEGPFAPLHQLNPTRLRILATIMAKHFGRSLDEPAPFAGLSLCDVGCGGGLVTEPMARLGFTVTGLDASDKNIETARDHAAALNLNIDYRVGAPEDQDETSEPQDVVLALEVVEHVADMSVFISGLAKRLGSDGVVIFSTINRTAKSLLLAKAAAEYILRWVPPGTHQWNKFVRPSELSRLLRQAGFEVQDIHGMTYDLATGEWTASSDVSVNYILSASRT